MDSLDRVVSYDTQYLHSSFKTEPLKRSIRGFYDLIMDHSNEESFESENKFCFLNPALLHRTYGFTW